MSNNNSSIFDFDYTLICEYFSMLERQGPGSPEITLKALSFIDSLSKDSHIADLGCGSGGQTITLAQHAPGNITGIDLSPQFIDLFNRNACQQGLQDRVKGIVANMEDLPFDREELDLIWSEGAISHLGFEHGIKAWRKHLKPGAYLAVSEAVWFTAERPEEIRDFWLEAYPEIDTIPVKMAQLQNAGYLPVACFMLPKNCWTECFFDPQVNTQQQFLTKYPDNEKARMMVDYMRHEAGLYARYGDYYGYAFFVARKIDFPVWQD